MIFEGQGVRVYQAMAIAHALRFYARTGIKVNTAYSPAAMLRTASGITGHKYRRGQYGQAEADLLAWIGNQEYKNV
jgi:hypothetical protein